MGVGKQRDAALRQRADLGERDGDGVGGHGDGLAVKVAAGQDLALHLALGREHQRVVGDRVGLAFDRRRRRAEQLLALDRDDLFLAVTQAHGIARHAGAAVETLQHPMFLEPDDVPADGLRGNVEFLGQRLDGCETPSLDAFDDLALAFVDHRRAVLLV